MTKPLRLASRMRHLEQVPSLDEASRPGNSNYQVDRSSPFQSILLKKLESALLGGETHYTVRPGIPKLRRNIGSLLAARGGPPFGAEDSIEPVLITTGASESLFVVLLSLPEKPGSVLLAAETSCLHLPLFRLMQLEPVEEERSDLRCIYRPRSLTDAIHFELLERAKRRNLPDVLDLGPDWDSPLPPIDPERTLILGSLNELPGLFGFRVGYLLGPEGFMRRCRTWKQAFSICTAAPSQRAAILKIEENSR